MTSILFDDRAGAPAATYEPTFLDPSEAEALLRSITAHRSAFTSGFMIVRDVWVKTPRLVAEVGDGVHVYPDTGPNEGWFDSVRTLRDRVADHLGQPFNYAIINWYRDGRDFTGWHADKMSFHTDGTVIAMVSVGSPRRFEFRRSADRAVMSATDVGSGSLLVMRPGSQDGFEHSLRPSPAVDGVRISITLRHVRPTEPEPCTCQTGVER